MEAAVVEITAGAVAWGDSFLGAYWEEISPMDNSNLVRVQEILAIMVDILIRLPLIKQVA